MFAPTGTGGEVTPSPVYHRLSCGRVFRAYPSRPIIWLPYRLPMPYWDRLLGGKGCQSIKVRVGLPVWVQGLDADMACSGVEMCLDALLDYRLLPPGNHGVEKTVATTVCQVLLAEAEAQPVITVIGQGHVKSHRLTRDLAGLSRVLDE